MRKGITFFIKKKEYNKKGRIEIQPRLKIQYPMKNQLLPDKRHTNNNFKPDLKELQRFFFQFMEDNYRFLEKSYGQGYTCLSLPLRGSCSYLLRK
jgi:hypothetical protein